MAMMPPALFGMTTRTAPQGDRSAPRQARDRAAGRSGWPPTALFSLAAGASDASVVRRRRDLAVSGAAADDGAVGARPHHHLRHPPAARRARRADRRGARRLAARCMQGLFRNPLADPGLVGVSAGAEPRRGRGHRARRHGAGAGHRAARHLRAAARGLLRRAGDDADPLPRRDAARPDLGRHHAARRHRARRAGHGASPAS